MSLPQVSLVLVSSSSLISTFLSNSLTEEDLKVFKDLSSGPTTEGAATCDLDSKNARYSQSPGRLLETASSY